MEENMPFWRNRKAAWQTTASLIFLSIGLNLRPLLRQCVSHECSDECSTFNGSVCGCMLIIMVKAASIRERRLLFYYQHLSASDIIAIYLPIGTCNLRLYRRPAWQSGLQLYIQGGSLQSLIFLCQWLYLKHTLKLIKVFHRI